MELRVEGNKQSMRLVCSGNATVEAAAEIQEVVIDSLEKTKTVVIDVSGIEKVDISFLQLLVSAEKTAQQKKKSIKIEPTSYSQPLIDVAIKTGFCREQEHLGDASMHTILATYTAQVTQEADNV